MVFNKDELIKEVFELEMFKALKAKFPNEDFENAVLETLEAAFGSNGFSNSNSITLSNEPTDVEG
jgi:hypothetical protein